MSTTTEIEWTDATWNPVTGCSKITRGCDFCYAERFSERFRGVPGHPFERGFNLTLRPERLIQPLGWKQPRRVFVNSMSDLFHDFVPDDYIVAVGETHSVREFAELAFRTAGLDYREYVVSDPRFFRPAEVDLLLGDSSKARTKLGWYPEVAFCELVEEMVLADCPTVSRPGNQ